MQKKEFLRAARPKRKLTIGVTQECNSHCEFCVFNRTDFFLKDLGALHIKRSLARFKKRYSYVSFTGGEPTLRRDIGALVRYAKKLGYFVQLTTNGRLFAYKDFCKKMIRAGVDLYYISLSAHSARLYESLSRSEGSFSQVVAGVANLLGLTQRVAINTVVNKKNYAHLPAMARFLMRLGLREVQFTFMRNPAELKGQHPSHFKKGELRKVIASIQQSIDIIDRAGRNVSVVLVPYCHMKGYERYVRPYRFNEDEVIHIKWKREPNIYPNVGKFVRFYKNETCERCNHSPYCEGIEASSPWLPQAS